MLQQTTSHDSVGETQASNDVARLRGGSFLTTDHLNSHGTYSQDDLKGLFNQSPFAKEAFEQAISCERTADAAARKVFSYLEPWNRGTHLPDALIYSRLEDCKAVPCFTSRSIVLFEKFLQAYGNALLCVDRIVKHLDRDLDEFVRRESSHYYRRLSAIRYKESPKTSQMLSKHLNNLAISTAEATAQSQALAQCYKSMVPARQIESLQQPLSSSSSRRDLGEIFNAGSHGSLTDTKRFQSETTLETTTSSVTFDGLDKVIDDDMFLRHRHPPGKPKPLSLELDGLPLRLSPSEDVGAVLDPDLELQPLPDVDSQGQRAMSAGGTTLVETTTSEPSVKTSDRPARLIVLLRPIIQRPCLIYGFLTTITVSISLTVGLCYTMIKDDASGGFTIAAYVIAVGAFSIGPWFYKHLNTCQCLGSGQSVEAGKRVEL